MATVDNNLGQKWRFSVSISRFIVVLMLLVLLLGANERYWIVSIRNHNRNFTLEESLLKNVAHMRPITIYNDEAETTKACGIPNVCLHSSHSEGKTERVVYVPSEYESLKRRLQSCLGFQLEMKFYNRASPPTSLREPLRSRMDVDSLGLPVVDRYFTHFAHFGPEFLRNLLPISLFLSKPRRLRPRCLSQNGSISECTEMYKWPSNPRVIVSSSASKVKWTQDFLALITKDGQYLHNMTAYDAEDAPPICVRSMLTSGTRYSSSVQIHDRWLQSRGVIRNLKQKLPCSPRVVVLLREWNWRLARTIPDPQRSELRSAIEKQLSSVGIKPKVELIVNLSHARDFTKQIAVMQRADILVCVHGAELTNALFMRRNAHVIELSPFGFQYGYFDGVFATAGVKSVRLCAPPDPTEFRKCIIKSESKINAENAHKMPPVIEYNRLLQQYRANNNTTPTKESCQLHNPSAVICARSQQLPIKPIRVAVAVAKRASDLCNSAKN